MQQQNKIEFLAKPIDVSIEHNYNSNKLNADIKFAGHKLGSISLHINQEEMDILFMKDCYAIDNTYKITIENITEPPKAHELLQVAAKNANLGNSKLAVEQAIKALKELVK